MNTLKFLRFFKGKFAILTVSVALFALLFASAIQATAPRIASQMFGDERKADIVAYEITPLITANQSDGGLAIAILSAAFNAAEQKLLVDILPAKPLAKYALLNNEVVAIVGNPLDLSEKEKKQVMSEAFFLQQNRYFYFKPAYPDGLPWKNSLTDLKGLKYGGLYGFEKNAYQKAGISVIESDVRSLLDKLQKKELDFIGIPDLVGRYWISKAYPIQTKDFASLTVNGGEQPLYVMFAKSNPRSQVLYKAFVTGLDKIIKNGQYEQFLEKDYGGKDKIPTDFVQRLQNYRNRSK